MPNGVRKGSNGTELVRLSPAFCIMADLFDFDQLNTLKFELEQIVLDPARTVEEKTKEAEDALFEFFVDMYFLGVLSSQEDLNTQARPTDEQVSESIFQKVRGEDFRDRTAA